MSVPGNPLSKPESKGYNMLHPVILIHEKSIDPI